MRKVVLILSFFISLSCYSGEMESTVRKAILKTSPVANIIDKVEDEAIDVAESKLGKRGASLAALAIGAGVNQEVKFRSSVSGIGVEGSVSRGGAFLGLAVNF